MNINVKFKYTRKCHRQFRRQFPRDWVPCGNNIQNLVSRVGPGILIDRKQKSWVVLKLSLNFLPICTLSTLHKKMQNQERLQEHHNKTIRLQLYKNIFQPLDTIISVTIIFSQFKKAILILSWNSFQTRFGFQWTCEHTI